MTGAKTKVAVNEGDSGPDKGDGDGDDPDDCEGVTKGRFPEPDRESSECYQQEAQEDGRADVESSAKPKFEKIANLKPKQKAWLKKYWSMVYPDGYADAMTQDK